MGQSDTLVGQFADRCKQELVEDGKKIIITCSNCGEPLAEIWCTRPRAQVQTKVIATCGLCGDKSFERMIVGGFHMANAEGSKVHRINNTTGPITEDESGMITMSLTIITEKK